MSVFDKMFKKNAFDQKLDDTFEKLMENNPVMRKARATIDEGENNITHSLERELYGDGAELSKNHSFPEGDNEDVMQNWSSMINQLLAKELNAYKICPSCDETVPAELDHCPHCGTRLPEHTAAEQICSYIRENKDSFKDGDKLIEALEQMDIY